MSDVLDFKRNTLVMAAGTTISRATGLGRTVALAIALGAQNPFANSYSLANNVPNIIYELVVGGILSATLIPLFSQSFAKEKEHDAWEAVSVIFTATLAVITLLTAVLALAAPLIIDLYTFLNEESFARAEQETGTYLLRLFAPQVAIYGFISVATALLNTRRTFGPPMFAPILNNIVVIGVLLAMPHISQDLSLEAMQHDRAGLTFLGLGTTAGVVAMGLLFVPYMRRVSAGRLHLSWNFRHPAIKTLVRMSGWTIGFVIANQVAFWVMLLLAGEDSHVNELLTAYQFFILPHGILSVSVMSALQPALAEQWANRDTSAFKHTMDTGIRTLMLVIVPTGLLVALVAQPTVSIIFEHGRTTAESAETMGWLVAWMTVGLPGFSAFIFFTRVLQAMHDAKSVFWLYVFQNGINVVTAFPLYWAFGLNGLGISQSVAYAFAAVAGFATIRRRAGSIGGHRLVSGLARICASTAIMAIGAVATLHWLPTTNAVAELLSASAVATVLFVGAVRLLAPDELALLLRRGGGKLRSPTT